MRVKDGIVFVNAPFWVGKRAIDDFVNSKQDWINKALARQTADQKSKNYVDGEEHLLFGEQKILKVNKADSIVRTALVHEGENLVLTIYQGYISHNYISLAERAFMSFYQEQLIAYLTEKVNYYANQLNVDYRKIEIKKVSSIWGSCSAKNVLSFNRKLVQSPKEIIDYVVIHEVCHLKERNHSSRFWALVSRFDKNYKNHRRWLHQNGVKLDI